MSPRRKGRQSTSPRIYQQWQLIEVGKDNQDVLYRIENVRSGKVLDTRAHETYGPVSCSAPTRVTTRTTNSRPVYEIVNRKSGHYLRVDTNARAAIKLGGQDEGEPQQHQWQLLPVSHAWGQGRGRCAPSGHSRTAAMG